MSVALDDLAADMWEGLLALAVGAGLQAAGYQLFPINPLAVSRYRDRYAVSRAKSDPGDALVLANILRTHRPAHRPIPEVSELARSIRVLARAQQDRVIPSAIDLGRKVWNGGLE
jgi:transposase